MHIQIHIQHQQEVASNTRQSSANTHSPDHSFAHVAIHTTHTRHTLRKAEAHTHTQWPPPTRGTICFTVSTNTSRNERSCKEKESNRARGGTEKEEEGATLSPISNTSFSCFLSHTHIHTHINRGSTSASPHTHSHPSTITTTHAYTHALIHRNMQHADVHVPYWPSFILSVCTCSPGWSDILLCFLSVCLCVCVCVCVFACACCFVLLKVDCAHTNWFLFSSKLRFLFFSLCCGMRAPWKSACGNQSKSVVVVVVAVAGHWRVTLRKFVLPTHARTGTTRANWSWR